jgi:hypothetical protein
VDEHQRGSTGMLSRIQRTGRAPVAGEAFLDLLRLLWRRGCRIGPSKRGGVAIIRP